MNNKYKLLEQSIKEPIRTIKGEDVLLNPGHFKKLYQYKGFIFYMCPIFNEYCSYEGQAIGDVWAKNRETLKRKVDMRINMALEEAGYSERTYPL
jgi:hypothetical protein